MSLDLLKYFDGQIKRWYRHDLESSAWCLAFHMLTSGPTEWLATHNTVYNVKVAFKQKSAAYSWKSVWADYEDFVLDWIGKWSALDSHRNDIIRRLKGLKEEEKLAKLAEEDAKVEDKVYIKEAIDAASKLEGSVGLEVFESADIWINVTLTVI